MEVDDDKHDMQVRLLANWNKPFMKLPVYKDLGRLIANCVVVDKEGHSLYREVDYREEGHHVSLYHFLLCLCRLTDDVEAFNGVEEQYYSYVKDSENLSKSLLNFFSSDILPPGSAVIRLLKGIQQEILVAPVLYLRKYIYDEFPYRDVVGTWSIAVEIDDSDHISVSHIKRESSHSDIPSEMFGFEWRFTMTFGSQITAFHSKVHILDWWFHKEFKPERKHVLESMLERFITKTDHFSRIWRADISLSNFHQNFLDTLLSLEIFGEDNYYEDPVDVLIKLSSMLEDTSNAEDICQLLISAKEEFPDNHRKQFVAAVDKIRFEDNYITNRLLRAFHESIIDQGTKPLLKLLYVKIPFKFQEPESIQLRMEINPDTIHVIYHITSASRRSDSPFTFKWNIILIFNRIMTTMKSAEVTIVDWDIGKLTIDQKDIFVKAVDTLVHKNVAVLKKLNPPLTESTLHDNLFKLVADTEIIKDGQLLLSATHRKSDITKERLYTIIHILSQGDTPEVVNLIEDYERSIIESDDVSLTLKSLFHDLEMLGITKTLLPILKCFQKSVFTAAFLELRKKIYPTHPFKEVKGYWHISIKLKGNDIYFEHKRKEQSHNNHNLEAYFEFDWIFSLIFTSNFRKLKTDYYIVNWGFTPNTDANIQTSLLECIAPFVDSASRYRKIWKRKVSQFEMGTGIVNLARRLKLVIRGEVIFDGSIRNENTVVYELLVILMRIFEGKTSAFDFREQLKKFLKEKSNTPTTWDSFFSLKTLEEFKISDESPFIRFLKANMVEILNPALSDLKNKYGDKFPFQPIHSSFITTVTMDDSIIICHKRGEQARDDFEGDYFAFDWDLSLNFKSMNCEELFFLDTGIIEVIFNSETERSTQFEMQSQFSRATRGTGAFRTTLASIPSSEVLEICLNELRKHDVQIKVQDHENEVLNNVKVIDLLECLARTLFSNVEKLPEVLVTAKKQDK